MKIEVDLDNLSCDSAWVVPVPYQWTDLGTAWDLVVPDPDGLSDEELLDLASYLPVAPEEGLLSPMDWTDEYHAKLTDLLWGALNTEDHFFPMMCYYYPLPGLRYTVHEAQMRVLNTACVVATVGGEPVLALGGGGMDLTWDIIEAYVLLGLMPPLHFCNPPYTLDQMHPTKRALLLNACRASLYFAQRICEQDLRAVDQLWREYELDDQPV